MTFFQDEIEKNGLEATFQQFIFSHDANWGGDEPRMMDRFLAGLLHPMIHFGHAAEFGVPGMAIEGKPAILLCHLKNTNTCFKVSLKLPSTKAPTPSSGAPTFSTMPPRAPLRQATSLP